MKKRAEQEAARVRLIEAERAAKNTTLEKVLQGNEERSVLLSETQAIKFEQTVAIIARMQRTRCRHGSLLFGYHPCDIYTTIYAIYIVYIDVYILYWRAIICLCNCHIHRWIAREFRSEALAVEQQEKNERAQLLLQKKEQIAAERRFLSQQFLLEQERMHEALEVRCASSPLFLLFCNCRLADIGTR